MPSYTPTTNPGDTRRRARQVLILNPLNSIPSVEFLEQDVVRVADGEKALENLGGVTVAIEGDELAFSFPILDPSTDTDTGAVATTAQAFALVYSWVRAKQALRDAQQEN